VTAHCPEDKLGYLAKIVWQLGCTLHYTIPGLVIMSGDKVLISVSYTGGDIPIEELESYLKLLLL